MKKCVFYSSMRKDGKNQAVLHSGYTDGVFYYYKNEKYCNIWYAIHPASGLSIAQDYTRKATAEKAHNPELLAVLRDRLNRDGEKLKKEFARCIELAREA